MLAVGFRRCVVPSLLGLALFTAEMRATPLRAEDAESAKASLSDDAETTEATATSEESPIAASQRLAQAGKVDEALALLDAASDDVALSAQKAILLAGARRWDQAAEELTRLHASHSTHEDYWSAALYSAELAYTADRRTWSLARLEALSKAALTPSVKRLVHDSIVWCRWEPRELKRPTSELWEDAARYAQSPLFPIAAMQRAESLAKVERLAEAGAVYRRLLELLPESRYTGRIQLAAARTQEQAGEKREAIIWCERLLERESDVALHDQALYLLAWCRKDTNDEAGSLDAFRRLTEQFPHSPYWSDAACRTAEAEIKAGRLDAADSILKQLATSEIASSEIRRRVLFLQAQSAVARGKWEEVDAPLTKLLAEQITARARRSPLEATKPSASVEGDLQLQAEFWLAEAAYRRHDYDLAEERFTLLREATADRNESWLSILPLRSAQIASHKRLWSDALSFADAMKLRYPKYERMFEVDYLRGRCLLGLARFQESREALTSAVHGDKSDGETAAAAQWMIGETLFLQKRFDEATAAYERVNRHGDHARWQAAAALQIAKCHERQGDFDAAATHYERLMNTFPDSPYAVEAKSRLTVVSDRESIARQRPTTKASR